MKRVIPSYKSLVDILQDAVDKENDAEQYYLEAAALAHTAEVKEFLFEMSRMERDHSVQLSKQLETLRAEQTAINGILSSYDENPEGDTQEP